MNGDAQNLNKLLTNSVSGRLLSETGKRLYFPHGIVAQCAEASEYADLYNVSVGMAFSNGQALETEVLKNQLPMQSAAEAVAYAPTPGDKELCNLWNNELKIKNPSLKSILFSESLVVPGLTNGIAQCASLFINPGDTVILPDLHWGNYRLIFETAYNATVKTFQFFSPDGCFNSAGLEKAIEKCTEKKLCFVFNFPNNPTGFSLRKSEAEECLEILKRAAQHGFDILCICDDAYFGLFYEDDLFSESLFSKLSSLHENILAVKIDGATKEDFFWGMRLGFITFGSKNMTVEHYDALCEKTKGSIRASVSSSSRIAQTLLYKALTNKDYAAQKDSFTSDLKSRYIKVKKIIHTYSKENCLVPLPFNSGYFLCLKTKGNAEKLRQYLLHKKGIGTVAFGENYLRVAYAGVNEHKLEDLFSQIYIAAKELFSDSAG